MKKTMLAALLLASGLAVGLADAPKNGSVTVESKAQGDNLEFTFKAQAKEGMEINLEGPWKLDVKGHDGLNLAKTSFPKGEMNEKLPGFVFATAGKPTKDSGELEYTMVAFVCTKEKTQCFREVYTGKAGWKVAGK